MSPEILLCIITLTLITISVYDHVTKDNDSLISVETEVKGNVTDVFRDLTRIDGLVWLTPWFWQVNPVDKRPLSKAKVFGGVIPLAGSGSLSIPLRVTHFDRSSGLLGIRLGGFTLLYSFTPSLTRPAHTTFSTEIRVERMSRIVKGPIGFLLYHTYKRHLFSLRYSFQEKYNTATPGPV